MTDNEYMNAYFVIYGDYLSGGDKFTKEELRDIIQYYLQNPDLSAKLNTFGTNSNQMIGSILAEAGVGFDCGSCDVSIIGLRCCTYRIGEVPMAYECVGNEVMGVKSYSWKQLWQCTYGCCANKCCLSPEGGGTTTRPGTTTSTKHTSTSTTTTTKPTTTTIGDFCQSDKDCILAYGPCWICPKVSGNCMKGDKNCERDDTCSGLYGPSWKCVSSGCCAPLTTTTTTSTTTTTGGTTTTTGSSTTTSTTSTTTTTIGDFCQSDKDCILAYGPCWICPKVSGNCMKGDKNCERDDTCSGLYGPSWKCVSPGCCAPLTTTTTSSTSSTTTTTTTTSSTTTTTTTTSSTTTTSGGGGNFTCTDFDGKEINVNDCSKVVDGMRCIESSGKAAMGIDTACKAGGTTTSSSSTTSSTAGGGGGGTTTTTTLPGSGNCQESDGGKKPYKGGICFDDNNQDGLPDTCADSDTLTEYYCSSGQCKPTDVLCPQTTSRQSGCILDLGGDYCAGGKDDCDNLCNGNGYCMDSCTGDYTPQPNGDDSCDRQSSGTVCCCKSSGGGATKCDAACKNLNPPYNGPNKCVSSGEQCSEKELTTVGLCDTNYKCCCTGGQGGCSQTDQNNDPKAKGVCIDKNKIAYPDRCNGDTLIQYSCTTNGDCVAPSQNQKNCKDYPGYLCKEDYTLGAACQSSTAPGQCVDDDNGVFDYEKSQKCTDDDGTEHWDYCQDATHVVEWICDPSNPKKCKELLPAFPCPMDRQCKDSGSLKSPGACAKANADLVVTINAPKYNVKTCEMVLFTVTVHDSAVPSNPVPGALVRVSMQENPSVAYTCTTDQEGQCKNLQFKENWAVTTTQTFHLVAEVILAPGYNLPAKSQPYTINVAPRFLTLKEVTFNPNPVQSTCKFTVRVCVADKDKGSIDPSVVTGIPGDTWKPPQITIKPVSPAVGTPVTAAADSSGCHTFEFNAGCSSSGATYSETMEISAELACYNPLGPETRTHTTNPIPLTFSKPTVTPADNIKSGDSLTLQICLKNGLTCSDGRKPEGYSNDAEITYTVTCDGKAISTADGGKGKTSGETASNRESCYKTTITAPKVDKETTCTVKPTKAVDLCHTAATNGPEATFKVKPTCQDECTKLFVNPTATCVSSKDVCNNDKGTVANDGYCESGYCCCKKSS